MPPKKNRRRRTRKYQQTRTNNNDFCLIPLEDITTPDENINNAEATTSNNSDLDNVAVIQKRCIDDEFFILGEGSFGLVTLGILKTPDGDTTKVALKAVNFEKRRSPGDVFTCREMLKEEAVVMAKFDHANVVRLLGVQKKPFKLVIEYMVHGDLLDAVKLFNFRLPKPSLCPEELFAYVTDKLLNEDIAARPHFSQVKEDLGSIDYDDGSAAAVSKLGQLLRNLMFF
ncbi:hypothetical protein NQ315_007410 [Exocentrus adspersus]|uniref:Protein kinase domain-containing protein n=1 Tax=Exocentrus adspersus TaxID=1586481 RepID=A0AAV8VHL6_9CUCU|nr:hypothetical protein NQ315_007410 [Exocentrus adspersus]